MRGEAVNAVQGQHVRGARELFNGSGELTGQGVDILARNRRGEGATHLGEGAVEQVGGVGLVREHARQARTFLNLFAYTGTATCYAADAGVEETITVDLSNTYLDWAERNMALNGFTGSAHHFVRDDVLAWVEQQVRGRNRWDLIFCDPPTFSNSSRMGERTWDVQRDHVELLKGVVGLLEQGGVAIFSCNLRSFKPDVEALRAAGIGLEDITERTIPEDFQRNKRIHHCYLVRRL